MNKIFLLAVVLLSITNFTIAQQKTNTPPVTITKGYYSIYRNAEKLNHQAAPVVVDSSKYPNVYTKGFYAISSKHKQLHKGGKSLVVTTHKHPVATKGYYSIKPATVRIPEENLVAEIRDTAHAVRDEN